MWNQDNPISDERPLLDIAQAGSSDCHLCRQRTLDADSLRVGSGRGRGKQLGRLERAVLLGAGRSQAGMGSLNECRRVPVLASDFNVVQQTALRAAASRLREIGLITLRRSTTYETDVYLKSGYETGKLPQPTRGHPDPLRRRLAKAHWSRRTLLGEGIAISYRDVLKTPGQRLRWDSRLDFALLGAHTRCLCRHSEAFRAAIEDEDPLTDHTPQRF